MTTESLEDTIRATFELRGEEVVRLRTGKVVKDSGSPTDGYTRVKVGGRLLLYHRIKFFLAYGFLPEMVDHEDRDRRNSLLSNLRAANGSLNQHNRARTRELPRGVHFRSGRKKPYVAQVQVAGKKQDLGYYTTAGEASEIVEAQLQKTYGSNYSPP